MVAAASDRRAAIICFPECFMPGAPATLAVIRPDGRLMCYPPCGKEGLLFADIDLAEATRLLAARLRRPAPSPG